MSSRNYGSKGDSELRKSITTAAAQVDALLSQSAGEVGESRGGNRRIAFVPPLGIAFAANESTRRAKVLHVWSM